MFKIGPSGAWVYMSTRMYKSAFLYVCEFLYVSVRLCESVHINVRVYVYLCDTMFNFSQTVKSHDIFFAGKNKRLDFFGTYMHIWNECLANNFRPS